MAWVPRLHIRVLEVIHQYTCIFVLLQCFNITNSQKNKGLHWEHHERLQQFNSLPPVPVLLQLIYSSLKTTADRGNMLEYYLRPLSHSIKRKKTHQN